LKGLFLRIITALALLLWAIDMVFPWQFLRHAEENHYTAIQERGSLIVGTMNNPISYFTNKDGERGFEYELAKAFADSLGVELEIKTFDNQEQLFNELDKHNIDLSAKSIPSLLGYKDSFKTIETQQLKGEGEMLQGVSYQIVTRNHMLEMQNLLRRSLGQEEVTQLETNVVLFEDLFGRVPVGDGENQQQGVFVTNEVE